MAIYNPTHSQNIWEHKEPVTHDFTSRPTALPCFGRRPWATTRPSPTLQRRVCPSTSVAEEKHKPLRKAPPPAFSLAVKNSTLHPAGKPSTSVILHSSFYSASLSQLVTKSHCCTCCLCAATPPPQSLGLIWPDSLPLPVYSPHYHCHDPSPTSFPHSQSCDSPPTSRCHNFSRGFDVLPDLAQPQLQPSALQVRHSSPTRLKFPDYEVQLSPPHLLVLARLPSELLLFI